MKNQQSASFGAHNNNSLRHRRANKQTSKANKVNTEHSDKMQMKFARGGKKKGGWKRGTLRKRQTSGEKS